ncbi:hypothetical protein SPACI_019460 [Sporomusa acidovorans DSM 3132]|uniref:Uncharacterized protein n=1 Tax=Sporomusa acidovorans (strain ATCC 49682 / DSM 3132 / Mol) TaxID=1123286 RepID=A0ABZ3J184_SPOA4|nr:hypothetical protein SPACI_13180 [Sporomusa acidovorans DSM 3132]SDE73872.1 hypothetical protein SAMN04488499_102061 [Sporomusa acidovorans]
MIDIEYYVITNNIHNTYIIQTGSNVAIEKYKHKPLRSYDLIRIPVEDI